VIFCPKKNLDLICSTRLNSIPGSATALTKLVLRLEEVQPSKVEANKACTGALLVMTSILHGHDLHSVGFFYIKQPATVFSLEKREINLFISKTGPKIASG
jgi:hypothetical protein